ncbi:uncharacterized protein LOC122449234 [Cervus canadensis]|uniref:uncharacterized protein LOC122449234 n=1 Tax=Cervus canadensis TaxID=1574408 RepID=UPI001C9E36E2|nr:uncharacterized protein LOC122449234 [Cervus canadensis]
MGISQESHPASPPPAFTIWVWVHLGGEQNPSLSLPPSSRFSSSTSVPGFRSLRENRGEIGVGTFSAVSITVMVLLEAIPGLASGRFTSFSLPWRLGGLPALRVMQLSNWNKPHRWSSPQSLGSGKQQELLEHFMRKVFTEYQVGLPASNSTFPLAIYFTYGFSLCWCRRPQKFQETLSGFWPRSRLQAGGGEGLLTVRRLLSPLSWHYGDGGHLWAAQD